MNIEQERIDIIRKLRGHETPIPRIATEVGVSEDVVREVLDEKDRDSIIVDEYLDGRSIDQIARENGIGERRVLQILRAKGVSRVRGQRLTAVEPKSKIHEKIGRKLYDHYFEKGMTRREAAERLGVSPHLMAKMEKGTTDIDLLTLLDLLTFMKITLEELLNDSR